MAYFKCPDCEKEHQIFGDSQYNIDILGKIPIDSKLAKACDKGLIELFSDD